jgi:hypothetical protein
MNPIRCRNASLVVLLLMIIVLPCNGAAKEEPGSKIDPEPLALLQRSTDYLQEMQGFRFIAHVGFDVLQENGQKIEFGSKREVAVRRPDRFRVDFEKRKGTQGGVVFDGKEITLFSTSQNVYAKESKTGDVVQALDHLSDELGVPTPLRDFLGGDAHDVLAKEIESAWYGGPTTVVGVACDHLAFRTAEVDYQLWIARGDAPLPWRVKITYKNEEGQPQFWAQFVEWKKESSFPPSLFTYTPPEGAEKISFAAHLKRPSSKEDEGSQTTGGEKR